MTAVAGRTWRASNRASQRKGAHGASRHETITCTRVSGGTDCARHTSGQRVVARAALKRGRSFRGALIARRAHMTHSLAGKCEVAVIACDDIVQIGVWTHAARCALSARDGPCHGPVSWLALGILRAVNVGTLVASRALRTSLFALEREEPRPTVRTHQVHRGRAGLTCGAWGASSSARSRGTT